VSGPDLSQSWIETSLGDLVEVLRGVSYKKPDARTAAATGLVPILRANNIGADGQLDFGDLVFVPRRYVSDDQLLQAGDIVVAASSGSRSVVGKGASLKVSWTGAFGAFCFALRPDYGIDAGFLGWFLQTREYREQVSSLAAGVNINNLRRSHVEGVPIRLPPLPEQGRIVAEIEKHFTRLDAAVAALDRAQANLRRYRASVLRAACEGLLVPAEGGHGVQPEGWSRRPLSDACLKIQDGTHFSPKEQSAQGDYKYVTAKNVRPWGLDLSDVTFVSEVEHRKIYQRCDPKKGDVLLVKDGVNTGDIALNTLDEEFSLLSSVCLFRPDPEVISGAYLRYYLASPIGQLVLTRNMSGTAIRRIILRRIKEAEVAFPSLPEQNRIVAEIERRLSVLSELEGTTDRSLRRASRVRQSILKRAFEGKLVPQDPNDEPASVLLGRIRFQREKEVAVGPVRARARGATPRARRRKREAQ
jgi:type I restriction enzyme S subunit